MDTITCHDHDVRFMDSEIVWEKRNMSDIRQCSYCGSIHPLDLLDLFEKGARLEGSDWKYGYPHKFYVEGISNPEAGQTVEMGSRSEMVNGERVTTPIMGIAPKTKTGKFYTKHLKDLIGTPEFEKVARASLDKQDGKYYPKVAFIEDNGRLSYITHPQSYDQAIEFYKQEIEKEKQ